MSGQTNKRHEQYNKQEPLSNKSARDTIVSVSTQYFDIANPMNQVL